MLDLPVSEYQSNGKQYQFPEDEPNPDKKNKALAKKIGEAMMAGYLNNAMSVLYSKRQDFATWRAYAADRQDNSQYQQKLSIQDPDGSRKNWMNISWDNMAIASSILARFQGVFNLLEHNITATSTDTAGSGLKEDLEFQLRAEIELSDTLALLNIPSSAMPEELPFVPKSMEELQIFKKLGNFRLTEEIASERILRHTYDVSNWGERIKKGWTKDAFTIGWFAGRRYMDYADYKIKAKYIDPALLIVPYSQFPDHHDIDKAGYIEFYTINQLRPSLMRDGYTEEQIFEIAKKYQGHMENGYGLSDFSYCSQFRLSHGTYPYESHKIAVLHYEWQSSDVQRWKKFTTAKGRSHTEKKTLDYKPEGTTKAEINDVPLMNYYQASWVIGSDCVYEFGPSPDLPRKSSNAEKHKDIALPSFFVYKVDDNPLMNRMIPHINKMNLEDKIFQNAMCKANVKGIAVFQDALKDINIGGGNLKPLETMKIYRDEGVLLLNKTDDWGKQNGGGLPLVEIEGGIGEKLNEFYTIIKSELGFIRDAIGMPSIADMAINNPNLLKGVAQLVSAESNTALQYIYSAYKQTKEKFSESVIAQVQVLALQNKLQGYQQVIGKAAMEAIKIRGYFPLAEMGIKLELKPDDEEKKLVMDSAMKAQMVPLDQGGISYAELMETFRRVSAGDIKGAGLYLAHKQQTNMENAQAMKKELIVTQTQAAGEEERKKVDKQMELEKFKTDEKLRLAEGVDKITEKSEKRKHDFKMDEIVEQGNVATARTSDTNQTAKEIQDKKTTHDIVKHLTPQQGGEK